MTTKQKTIFGGLVVVLVIAAAGVFPFGWRVALIGRMFRGDLPGVSWGELVREVRPFGGEVLLPRNTGTLREFKFVRKRTDGSRCPFLWETRLGSFWGRADDNWILGELNFQMVDGAIYNSHGIATKPGDVIFDVGSHLGVFTKMALDAGAGTVVAIEPEPINNTCFKQTFEKEIKEGRVVLVEAAAWHSKETLHFRVHQESWAGMVGQQGLKVQGLPMDDIVEDLKLDRVNLVKLDIEGAERHALNGFRRTMARLGPDLVVSVYHRPDDPQVVQKIVAAANPAYNLRESERRTRSYYMDYFTIRQNKSPQ
ncbi:MAG TPA: FkbM family methyltransferase [Vicinamibacterales bacterium]|nr:FkbM family methyltransferase [Vicinamibacterales bacterium]